MSKQIIAYGATVERSIDGTTGWARIPECKGVAVPVVTTEYQDATSLDSVGGFREYIKGMKDAGEISVPCGYTSAGYAQQLGDQAADDAIYYRVTLRPAPGQTSGDVFEYRGFPTPELETGDVGQIVGMSVKIRTTGKVEWEAGAEA